MALDSGVWVLPARGDIAVWRPRTGDDLSALPSDRVIVLTGFRPDHDHFKALGYRTDLNGQAAAGLICNNLRRTSSANPGLSSTASMRIWTSP